MIDRNQPPEAEIKALKMARMIFFLVQNSSEELPDLQNEKILSQTGYAPKRVNKTPKARLYIFHVLFVV